MVDFPDQEISLKEEGLIHLFRVDSKKFGRGISAGLKTSRFGGPKLGEGLLAIAAHTIADERERFPNNPDVQGKDFEVGVVVGEWIKLKDIEFEMRQNPTFRSQMGEAQGEFDIS